MQGKVRWVALSVLSSLAMSGMASAVQRGERGFSGTEGKPLSRWEMAGIVGAVQTNSVTMPSDNEDNLPYSISYTNTVAASRVFEIWAGSTKVAYTTVGASASGTWQTRTMWPISGVHTESTKYWDGASRLPSWSGVGRSVDTSNRMIRVKVLNSVIGLNTTNVDASSVQGIFDNPTYSYSYHATPSVDAVYHQCTPGATQLQFRYTWPSGGTIPALYLSSCNIYGTTTTPLPQDPDDLCIEEVFNESTSNGTDLSHVVLVALDDIEGAAGGFHARGDDTNEYMIAFEETWSTHPVFTMLIAHELGHVVLSHPHEDDEDTKCTGTSLANDNLMCPSAAGAGFDLESGECTSLYTTLPAYFVDHN